ncbi:glycosyltransferase family A protein [Streptomyces sp. NPDC005012]|uniref:glycosyltransferase family 2 protein n=1 Tax=Streptomyces sp. NPDC005012 TaxID=3154558 RepID=UPI0033B65ED3
MTRVKTISVITAVHAPGAHHLPEAYKSLLAQDMPRGWDWQWVIQEDGHTDGVVPHVPDDERVCFGQGRAGRAAMARMLGLARATGEVVKVLDADDQLTPGALARDVEALERNAEVGWVTSRVLDLLPDGSTLGFDGDPDAGVLERGSVLEYWRANDFRASVHPATLAIRKDLLLALGGWMALPASEDTGLLLALSAVSRGWFNADVGLLYRKWDGQVTGAASHADPAERAARMRVIEARAAALAQSGWSYSPPTGS